MTLFSSVFIGLKGLNHDLQYSVRHRKRPGLENMLFFKYLEIYDVDKFFILLRALLIDLSVPDTTFLYIRR